jgi:hypothetical protein
MKTQIIYQKGPHKAIKQAEGDLCLLPNRVKSIGMVYFINIHIVNPIIDFNEKFNATTSE